MDGMMYYGWAIGVAIIILAVSLRRALPRVVHALADRMSRRGPPEADSSRSLEVLDDVQRRLTELEERVDFAERLLAKQRGGERLAKPQS